MKLRLRRIVLFTKRMDEMEAFYTDVLGLTVMGREEGWVDFAAGGANIALHKGAGAPGQRPPKISFYAPDVAATREALIKRGAKLGKIIATKKFEMCDGKDPDGNPFGISSRA